MGKYVYKSNREELLEQAKQIPAPDSYGFWAKLLLTELLVAEVIDVRTLAEVTGITDRSLELWRKKVDLDGWSALEERTSPGGQPRLTEADAEKLKAAVSGNPQDAGYELWNLSTVQDYIRTEFGVEYCISNVSKWMRKLGLTLHRPTTRPSRFPPPEVEEEFKQELQKVRNDPELKLVFQDEVHFHLQPLVTRMFAPKGTKLVVLSEPGREKVSYSGFVVPDTGELSVFKPERFNYETTIQTFRDFLDQAPALPEGRRYCLVLDNAPWHRKAVRLIWIEKKPEYQDIRDRLTYLSLPPYSPHLNPIEQVWRITRREVTHNHYFKVLPDMVQALDRFFGEHSVPNERLRSLCSWEFSKIDENGNRVKNGRRQPTVIYIGQGGTRYEGRLPTTA